MVLRRWNFDEDRFEPHEIPGNWNVKTAEAIISIDEVINCAECGEKLPFSESYPSVRIQTIKCYGYGVCTKCHAKEADESLATWRRKKEERRVKRYEKKVDASNKFP